ncbi:MAG: hypothetical protein K8S15_07605 [Candidatus Aegiribacteria sp.]|nr:hypothetical protein [Candidatus Aegiribacteria sp.]
MTKSQLTKRIAIFESAGFLLVIIVLWLDEIIDLPHRLFGAPVTPINYKESIFETFITLLLAWLIISLTMKLLKRINVLEGILPICSFCNKIRVQGEWIPFDSFIKNHSEADFSHSICPECLKSHYSDLMEPDEPDADIKH